MIEFTKSYKTADGKTFGTIEEAQRNDLKLLGLTTLVKETENITDWIVCNKVAIVDILTTTPNSKPKARASHGGTKTRKKTIITDAATSVTPTSNAASNYTGE